MTHPAESTAVAQYSFACKLRDSSPVHLENILVFSLLDASFVFFVLFTWHQLASHLCFFFFFFLTTRFSKLFSILFFKGTLVSAVKLNHTDFVWARKPKQ